MILLQASEDQRSTIQIGEAAQLAKLGIDTIRFYERRALLPRARRTGGQFRLFTVDDVERLIFIKQIQGLGFSGSLYEKSSNCSTCGTEENMRAER